MTQDMRDVKVEDLEGAALDWAVAHLRLDDEEGNPVVTLRYQGVVLRNGLPFSPLINWDDAGALLETYPCDLSWDGIDGRPTHWLAKCEQGSALPHSSHCPRGAIVNSIAAALLPDVVSVPAALLEVE